MPEDDSDVQIKLFQLFGNQYAMLFKKLSLHERFWEVLDLSPPLPTVDVHTNMAIWPMIYMHYLIKLAKLKNCLNIKDHAILKIVANKTPLVSDSYTTLHSIYKLVFQLDKRYNSVALIGQERLSCTSFPIRICVFKCRPPLVNFTGTSFWTIIGKSLNFVL